MKKYTFFLKVYFYENTIIKDEIRKVLIEAIDFFKAVEKIKQEMLLPNVYKYEITVVLLNKNI